MLLRIHSRLSREGPGTVSTMLTALFLVLSIAGTSSSLSIITTALAAPSDPPPVYLVPLQQAAIATSRRRITLVFEDDPSALGLGVTYNATTAMSAGATISPTAYRKIAHGDTWHCHVVKQFVTLYSPEANTLTTAAPNQAGMSTPTNLAPPPTLGAYNFCAGIWVVGGGGGGSTSSSSAAKKPPPTIKAGLALIIELGEDAIVYPRSTRVTFDAYGSSSSSGTTSTPTNAPSQAPLDGLVIGLSLTAANGVSSKEASVGFRGGAQQQQREGLRELIAGSSDPSDILLALATNGAVGISNFNNAITIRSSADAEKSKSLSLVAWATVLVVDGGILAIFLIFVAFFYCFRYCGWCGLGRRRDHLTRSPRPAAAGTNGRSASTNRPYDRRYASTTRSGDPYGEAEEAQAGEADVAKMANDDDEQYPTYTVGELRRIGDMYNYYVRKDIDDGGVKRDGGNGSVVRGTLNYSANNTPRNNGRKRANSKGKDADENLSPAPIAPRTASKPTPVAGVVFHATKVLPKSRLPKAFDGDAAASPTAPCPSKPVVGYVATHKGRAVRYADGYQFANRTSSRVLKQSDFGVNRPYAAEADYLKPETFYDVVSTNVNPHYDVADSGGGGDNNTNKSHLQEAHGDPPLTDHPKTVIVNPEKAVPRGAPITAEVQTLRYTLTQDAEGRGSAVANSTVAGLWTTPQPEGAGADEEVRAEVCLE